MSRVCLIPGCGKPAKCRGLCNNCYQIASQKVYNESITWEQLEKLNLASPSVVGRSFFSVALEAAMADVTS